MSTHDDNEHVVRAAVIVGGTFQGVIAHLNGISGLQFDAILVADVLDEIRLAGADLTQQNMFIVSPESADQIGVLIQELGKDDDQVSQIISRILYDLEGDSTQGLGQIPALGKKALERVKGEADRVINNFWTYLRTVAGGMITKCELYVFASLAGGTGRGQFQLITTMLRQKFPEHAQKASLSLRYILVDGGSYLGCGDRVEANGATGAAQVLSMVYDDPDKQPWENSFFHLITLPLVEQKKEVRDRLVREVVAMLLAPEYRSKISRAGANGATARAEKIGKMFIHRFIHYGVILPKDLVASVASAYAPIFRDLLDPRQLAGNATQIKSISAGPSITGDNNRPIHEVVADAIKDLGRVDALPELLGKFDAMATIQVELMQGGFCSGNELIDKELDSAGNIRTLLSDLRALEHHIRLAINRAATLERIARSKNDKAVKKLNAYWTGMFGSFFEKLFTPRCWRLWTQRRKSHRQSMLEKTAQSAREAQIEMRLRQTAHQELLAYMSKRTSRLSGIEEKLHRAVQEMDRLYRSGKALTGVQTKSIDVNIADILWAASLPVGEKLADILATCVTSLTPDAIARAIFGYTGKAEADSAMLAILIKNAAPQYTGTFWGQKQRESRGRHRKFIFIPLDQALQDQLEREYSRHDTSMQISWVSTGAGAFVGAVIAHEVLDNSDVVTPHYLTMLHRMAAEPGNLERSCVPGHQMMPDPFEFRQNSK